MHGRQASESESERERMGGREVREGGTSTHARTHLHGNRVTRRTKEIIFRRITHLTERTRENERESNASEEGVPSCDREFVCPRKHLSHATTAAAAAAVAVAKGKQAKGKLLGKRSPASLLCLSFSS